MNKNIEVRSDGRAFYSLTIGGDDYKVEIIQAKGADGYITLVEEYDCRYICFKHSDPFNSFDSNIITNKVFHYFNDELKYGIFDSFYDFYLIDTHTNIIHNYKDLDAVCTYIINNKVLDSSMVLKFITTNLNVINTYIDFIKQKV